MCRLYSHDWSSIMHWGVRYHHAGTCSCQTTVMVLSIIQSLVLTLSLSTCTVSAVVHAVMYKRLQRCRAELRGGELCSTPQLSQSLLWSRAAASLYAGGGDSVKAGPEGEEPATREEEEGEKMQANPSYLPIEMSYKSQESKYINVMSSWNTQNGTSLYHITCILKHAFKSCSYSSQHFLHNIVHEHMVCKQANPLYLSIVLAL